ncbi:hypothetical protein MHU86_15709 [Fragilaria crotonensis]|nr:hypothetical protein MHU86_15709 [Fragilaria crotonensis]
MLVVPCISSLWGLPIKARSTPYTLVVLFRATGPNDIPSSSLLYFHNERSFRHGFHNKRYAQVELSEMHDDEEPRVYGGIPEHLEVAISYLNAMNTKKLGCYLAWICGVSSQSVSSHSSHVALRGSHGLSKQVGRAADLVKGRVSATCFPCASALACSWDQAFFMK